MAKSLKAVVFLMMTFQSLAWGVDVMVSKTCDADEFTVLLEVKSEANSFAVKPSKFTVLSLDSPSGPVVVGYTSRIESGNPAEVRKLVVEALSRFGVPALHILVRQDGDFVELTVGLRALKNPKLAPHIAYHAERFTLRPFFAKLEGAGNRVQNLLLQERPVKADAIVRELSPEDADVLAQWSRLRERQGKELSIKELLDCG